MASPSSTKSHAPLEHWAAFIGNVQTLCLLMNVLQQEHGNETLQPQGLPHNYSRLFFVCIQEMHGNRITRNCSVRLVPYINAIFASTKRYCHFKTNLKKSWGTPLYVNHFPAIYVQNCKMSLPFDFSQMMDRNRTANRNIVNMFDILAALCSHYMLHLTGGNGFVIDSFDARNEISW